MIIPNINPGMTVTVKEILTNSEKDLISKVFQNYYCMGLSEIGEEDETAKSLFKKLGMMNANDRIITLTDEEIKEIGRWAGNYCEEYENNDYFKKDEVAKSICRKLGF